MTFPGRGEIWLVSLDPIVGHEIGKTRPALVISNDRNNEFAETVTVIPITSQTEKVYPFETSLPRKECNLSKDSKAKANQIRTVDKKRLVKLAGRISGEKMNEVEEAVNIHLGIV